MKVLYINLERKIEVHMIEHLIIGLYGFACTIIGIFIGKWHYESKMQMALKLVETLQKIIDSQNKKT